MANQYSSTYDRTKMQDITISEIAAFQQFLLEWASGANVPTFLKYKIFNAYNWNRLLDLINDEQGGTPATYDSLVGKWQIDFGNLQTASAEFVDKGTWASGVSYKKGNLIIDSADPYTSYICIADHTSSNANQPPNTTYWVVAQQDNDPNPIVVSATIPNGYVAGDVFLKTI